MFVRGDYVYQDLVTFLSSKNHVVEVSENTLYKIRINEDHNDRYAVMAIKDRGLGVTIDNNGSNILMEVDKDGDSRVLKFEPGEAREVVNFLIELLVPTISPGY